jgi:aldehyde dehydrogenase (NAD+)
MWEYLRPAWEERADRRVGGSADRRIARRRSTEPPTRRRADPPIDRTPKLFIGGKQARPDGGYSLTIHDATGRPIAEVAKGNRKDIRNAVEAARKAAEGWAHATAHNRAQVLYYVAENLAVRAAEFADRISGMTGVTSKHATGEVEASVRRLFAYAAWADKWDGQVHHTPFRNVTLAMPEPIGVTGIACPDEPALLGFVSVVAPAVAMGNTVVAIPSERWPLCATDVYQVLETSDVPPGVINIVTGESRELTPVLAAHDDVDAMWYFGDARGGGEVERLSAGNLKRTWVSHGLVRDWYDADQGEGHEFLREATQVKNIWIPYGE